MCKCCQQCFESCYWHLIEKRFCFDEDIALYEEPGESEKNNNMFDNMAFYDSVSVIAGRAIVTIDPLPEANPIMKQPAKSIQWPPELRSSFKKEISRSVPVIFELSEEEKIDTSTDAIDSKVTNNDGKEMAPDKMKNNTQVKNEISNTLQLPDDQKRKKSLRERRMSKSLYLKIDYPKEVPIIRQSSVPKFFQDIPEENQTASSALVRNSSTVLQSPMPATSEFTFDLYSVVQMERSKLYCVNNVCVPIHQPSRLMQIKDKIKLRRAKSSVSSNTLPHSHHM